MGFIVHSRAHGPEFAALIEAEFEAAWSLIDDTGGYYTAANVETGLQEVGQELLVHNLGGFEDRSNSTLSWGGTRTLTLTPTATDYYWVSGVRYSYSGALTRQIEDTSGLHVVFFDTATPTVLSSIANPTHAELDQIIRNDCIVATIYWATTYSAAYVLGDERHGIVMSGATHHYLHDSRGTVYRSGGGLSGYVLSSPVDADIGFDISDILFYDEDLEITVADGVASSQYVQVLTGEAEIPVLFRDDVDGSWTEQAASALPYLANGATPQYVKDDGDGTWSRVNVGAAKYYLHFLILTNDWQYPVKMIPGSTQYNTAAQARSAATTEFPNLGELPAEEFVLLYTFILKKTAGGTLGIEITDIIDYRFSEVSGGGAVSADHGSLGGLGDDDHEQYILHSLGSATGDFLVWNSVTSSFEAKTLAETGAILEADLDHDALQNYVQDHHKPHAGISAIAGGILSGGGTIDTDFTISLAVLDIDHDATSNFVANKHIDHTGVDITAGTGLTGGGDISATRTLNVIGGKGIGVAADSCYIDVTDTNWFLDEDAMGSNSATHVASQQSIVAYVAAELAGAGTLPADPGFDAFLMWDDSASSWLAATLGDGLEFSGLTMKMANLYPNPSYSIGDAVVSSFIGIGAFVGVSDTVHSGVVLDNPNNTAYQVSIWQSNGALSAYTAGAGGGATYVFGFTAGGVLNVALNPWVVDEDNMASDSATRVPTQQSVKAYVGWQNISRTGLSAGATQYAYTWGSGFISIRIELIGVRPKVAEQLQFQLYVGAAYIAGTGYEWGMHIVSGAAGSSVAGSGAAGTSWVRFNNTNADTTYGTFGHITIYNCYTASYRSGYTWQGASRRSDGNVEAITGGGICYTAGSCNGFKMTYNGQQIDAGEVHITALAQ